MFFFMCYRDFITATNPKGKNMIIEKPTIESWAWRIKKAGLTQGEMAGIVQTSASTLTKYIKGQLTPSFEVYAKIEEELASRNA